MTRSPIIRNAVGHYFDKPPMFEHNPDEVVALGAAIQAYNLTHRVVPDSTSKVDASCKM